MKHLTEEELVEHYYDTENKEEAIGQHLAACPECASAFAVLKGDLDVVQVIDSPTRDANYGRQVWSALAESLPAYREQRPRWFEISLSKGLLYASICTLLLAGAFYAGRIWEKKQPPQNAQKSTPARHDVVLVVISNHLDRSERLLVELKHAGDDGAEAAPPLRDEVRSLLTSNRVCKQNAAQMGDPALAAALDHLDRLLADLANQPDGSQAPVITRAQGKTDLENVLFEVRVLRSRMPEPASVSANHSSGGTI